MVIALRFFLKVASKSPTVCLSADSSKNSLLLIVLPIVSFPLGFGLAGLPLDFCWTLSIIVSLKASSIAVWASSCLVVEGWLNIVLILANIPFADFSIWLNSAAVTLSLNHFFIWAGFAVLPRTSAPSCFTSWDSTSRLSIRNLESLFAFWEALGLSVQTDLRGAK